jgi:hypothetical protein
MLLCFLTDAAELGMTICDGCGRHVDAVHIKERIERLEMATRFRPIHIQTLVVDACPLPSIEDFFYSAGQGASPRSGTGRAYFSELSKCAPDAIAKSATGTLDDETVLSEWQRRGLFLAYAVDCPYESSMELTEAVGRAARTLILRLNTSYRPKRVALIGATGALMAPLHDGGWNEKLLLDSDSPFTGPNFGARLASVLQRS